MSSLVVKKLEKMTVAHASKIIKAEDYQLMVQGRQLLGEIKKQAEELYQREKDTAYREAKDRAHQSTNQQMLRVASASINYLSQIEKKLTELVIESVKKIVGDLDNNEATEMMIKTALYQMRNESHVTLRVSLDEAPMIKERIKDIISNYSNIDFVDVVADKEIATGFCHLSTPLGSIKTGIPMQLKALEDALAKSFASRTEA